MASTHYRIYTDCFGYKMYATEVGNGWTDVASEATRFECSEPAATTGHRVMYFSGLAGAIVAGASCGVEPCES